MTAVRYATRDTSKADCYLGYEMYGEADEPLAMDYYFYVLSNGSRNLLVDTGFALEAGTRRGRTCIVPPLEALARLGFAAESISEVLITHFHYDHVGNVAAFPEAELLVPDRELEFWTGPLADRPHFAAYVEATEIDAHRRGASWRARSVPRRARKCGARITTMHVGGHCPGQLIVVVNGIEGPIVLTSDAVHYYEELDLDRPFRSPRRPRGDVRGLHLAPRAGGGTRHEARGGARPSGARPFPARHR